MQRVDEYITERKNEGYTPLMLAALEGHTKEVKTLLTRGADVNAKDIAGRTALMFAVINMHGDTVDVLLEHGANVNARADDGATALLLAASCGELRIVQALLNKGADLSGNFAMTSRNAASLAAEKGYSAVVDLLNRAASREQPNQPR